MKSLCSFEDFAKKGAPAPKAVQEKSVVAPARPAPKSGLKKAGINEAALLVDADYKVKLTLDVPVALVKAFLDKVKSETGKDATGSYTEAELAEEMVRYIVKKNLVIDQIPSSLAVGNGAAEAGAPAPDATTEVQNDAPAAPAAASDDPYAGAEDIDIPDDEPSDAPAAGAQPVKGVEFKKKVAEPGEGENIQLDPSQKIKK